MTDGRIRFVTLVALAVLGAAALARLDLTNSITHFMPTESDAQLVSLSLELVESPLSRRMVLLVDGGPESAAVVEDLALALIDHPEVAWVERGLDEAAFDALYELYFERRFLLASTSPETEIPQLTTDLALRARAEAVKRRLTMPDGMLVARTVGSDPLGLAERMLARLDASRPTIPADASFATLQLGLVHSPFDSARQRPLLAEIDATFGRAVAARRAPRLRLDQDGVNRFAVSAERSIRGDINLISSVSIVVVVGLFLAVFRSLRLLAIAFLVPLGGFVVAMAFAVSEGGSVHGITLGFGFALIGVAIDYPIHLLNHHALASRGDARATRDAIRGSLLLSAATTTLAFSSLTLSDFPGLDAMGRFGAIGIVAAFLLTVFALPAFLPGTTNSSATQRALAAGFDRLVDGLAARRGRAVALVGALVLFAALGSPRLAWDDDPSNLMTTDPILLAEAARVRARVADFDGSRFVVALADGEQAVLDLNSEIARRLRPLITSGAIDGIGSLDAFLWPESLQRRNRAAFARERDLAGRVTHAFGQAGFRTDAFEPFAEDLARHEIEPLRPADLEGSPFERALDGLVELDGRYAVVTFLRGVSAKSGGNAIEAALRDLPGAYYVDRGAIVGDLYAGYRASTTRRVALGALLVLVVLVLRYRSLRAGLLAFLPAGLGAACTLGAFGWLGLRVNVASAVSLLVILGMGVDYGIFAVDAAGRGGRVGVTLSSLLVSCVTSIFVFGVLALSAQPVLRSIGLTTGLGVLFALAAAPAAIALARAKTGAAT